MKTFLFLLLTFSVNSFSGEYIVKLNSGYKSLPKKFQFINQKSFTVLGQEYLKIQMSQKDLKSLKMGPEVSHIEPNVIFQAFEDRYLPIQWALSNMGHNEPISVDRLSPMSGKEGCDISALDAWNISKGSKEIKIAILDTGIDYNHPDLKSQLYTNLDELNGETGVDDDGNGYIDDIHGYDVINGDGDPLDDSGHGTHCAGIVGSAHNSVGMMGVLGNVSIISVKMLDHTGYGDAEASLKAIDYAVKAGATVLNCSWGSSKHSAILEEVLREVNDLGITVVAAAGNFRGRNNDITPTYPATYKIPNIISVAAHNAQAGFSSFSTRGPNSIHITAPGTNILSTWINGSYKVASGTSMAAPYVAASVALLRHLEPNLGMKEIRDRLMETAVKEKKLKGKIISEARIDLLRLITDQRD